MNKKNGIIAFVYFKSKKFRKEVVNQKNILKKIKELNWLNLFRPLSQNSKVGNTFF